MSSVVVSPDFIAAGVNDFARVGTSVDQAHAALASGTAGLLPAAADEVSVSIAQFFTHQADSYQAMASRAAAFYQQFVHQLGSGAQAYHSAETAAVAMVQPAAGAFDGIGQAITTGIQTVVTGIVSFPGLVAQAILNFLDTYIAYLAIVPLSPLLILVEGFVNLLALL